MLCWDTVCIVNKQGMKTTCNEPPSHVQLAVSTFETPGVYVT